MPRTGDVRRSITSPLAFLALLTLSACAGSGIQQAFPVPEDPGLYALKQNGELQRLDGAQDWEVETWPSRSDLPPETRFVVYDPASQNASGLSDQQLGLWKVSWVRSEIGADGQARPRSGSKWATAKLEPFRVPLNIRKSRIQPGTYLATPAQPLEPGLYSLQSNAPGMSRVARLGIGWSAVDRRDYSAANCVDSYPEQPQAYSLCTSQGEALSRLAVQGLEITLVDPLRVGDTLVIQGVVVNTTKQTREIPALEAVIRSEDGAVVRRWVFDPGEDQIAAGGRLKFKTKAPPPIFNASKVQISFVKGGAISGS